MSGQGAGASRECEISSDLENTRRRSGEHLPNEGVCSRRVSRLVEELFLIKRQFIYLLS